MTTAQLNTATKASLINYVAELETAKTKAQEDIQRAVNIANYFAQIIAQIENLLMNSPFVNKDGKIFRNIFWVLSNFATIKTVIETIINQIKEWRKQVEAINNPQPTV